MVACEEYWRTRKKFSKASVAIGIGKTERSLIVVHSGWLLQRVIHHSGDELIVALFGRGDAAGLAESVLAAPAERETVAGADTMTISIPWRAIVETVTSQDDRLRIDRELAREALALRDRLATLAFCSLEGRIAAFLLDLQRLTSLTPSFRLTQGMIAKAVGASRPKVNRCLKLLERRGLIAWRKASSPEIIDPVGLWRLT
jgi:CRP-like cAMP-binding protein